MKFRWGLPLMAIFLLLPGCRTNRMKDKLKHGRWEYTDTVNNVVYRSFGKYKKGNERKTWRYYENNKLVRKEKYQHGICHTATYFESGKIASEGKTKMVISETDTHWYYFGDWYFYDETGKLVRIKNYESGQLLNDTKMQ